MEKYYEQQYNFYSKTQRFSNSKAFFDCSPIWSSGEGSV